ncbi:tyrosine-type recombinase/integrase [Halorubrum distributum]|uniref:Integrase family protein n=1 Tax=Halorubrum distributum JCM 13916 TaxID=1230455 RepID=M0PP05_9EURY|nr:site-specific integrase [Halorubrum arcis]EMA71753.1 integrase family protein [Halorubrum arcis JCM 13916]
MSDLQPITPREAVRLYLADREMELSEKSRENHRYRLDSWIEFCNDREIDNMNDVTGRTVHEYRVWRQSGESDKYESVSKATLKGNLATLRVFFEFCASIDAVESGLRERVRVPTLSSEEAAREEKLSEENAEAALQYLEKFRYASREHTILTLLWHTGIRLGTLRSFDVGDLDVDDRCLDVRHQPDEGTPLKNGKAAERSIALGEYEVELLQDYIEQNRPDVTDEYGREPMFASTQGRLSESPIRLTVYRWTQPCRWADCPHGEDPKTCEFRNREEMSSCPSSISPHGVRRGAITKHLRDGTPEEVVSDRMNSSREVIDQHYDERSEREKMRHRRDLIQDL